MIKGLAIHPCQQHARRCRMQSHHDTTRSSPPPPPPNHVHNTTTSCFITLLLSDRYRKHTVYALKLCVTQHGLPCVCHIHYKLYLFIIQQRLPSPSSSAGVLVTQHTCIQCTCPSEVARQLADADCVELD